MQDFFWIVQLSTVQTNLVNAYSN
uniref:Uncharacterized protein n=1 Tax=Arundo donax TaxID=35708 RepID=A0A0A9BQ16_ARUDO